MLSTINFLCVALLISVSYSQTCSNAMLENSSPAVSSGFLASLDGGRCIYGRSHNDVLTCADICGQVGGACDDTDLGLLSDATNCLNAANVLLGDSITGNTATGASAACKTEGTSSLSGSGPNFCAGSITNGAQTLVCVCTGVASAGQDPHMHGLNGENLDVIKDHKSSNKFFSIYCDIMVAINALFSPNPETLLFMTEFAGRVGDVLFSLKLGKYPQIYGNYFTEEVEGTQNRTRFVMEAATIESDGSGMIIKTDNLEVMIKTASDVEGNVYFDIDLKAIGEVRRQASGIIGRSFERRFTNEEFSEYYQFMLQTEDDKFRSCPGDNGRF